MGHSDFDVGMMLIFWGISCVCFTLSVVYFNGKGKGDE